MPKKKKPGRPPKRKQDKQGVVFSLKVTSAERSLLRRKAEAAGLSDSAWVRKLIVDTP
jgi:hypothetical protein